MPGSNYAVQGAPRFAADAGRVSILPFIPLIGIFKRLFRASKPTRRQETTASRTNRVSTIEVSPNKIVGYQNQAIGFAAVGRSGSGEIVQGARFNWSSSDLTKVQIDDSGQASLLAPGLVWVTASTAFASSRVPVLIRLGSRPVMSDSEWQADQNQLRPDGSIGTVGQIDGAPQLNDSRERSTKLSSKPAVYTVKSASSVRRGLRTRVSLAAPSPPPQASGGDSNDFLYDELWSEPRNLVGSPRNRVMDSSRIGAVLPEGSNFEFSIPIDGLAGRGIPLGLGLHYNSRVWSRHGSAVTFNAVNTWPYVGFSMSFGRIVKYGSGSGTKWVLIESNGTRRYLGSGTGGTYQTNDGSHITYVGNSGSGTLYFNSGIKMSVTSVNNRLLVTQIRDRNGNFITISYKSQSANQNCNSGVGYAWKQALDTVTDTLGRVISFNYDDCNNLISITAPDYGSGTQTLAQFDYQAATISNSFSGLTVENLPSGQ
jgi:YD repeat-containing protein